VENAGAPPHPPLHLLPRTMDLWTMVRPRRFPFFFLNASVAAPDAIEFCLLLKLSAGRHTGGQHLERHLIVILPKKKVHIEVPSWLLAYCHGFYSKTCPPRQYKCSIMCAILSLLTFYLYQ
jgi:hypothetical protein